MRTLANKKIVEELRAIAARNSGVLDPVLVVEAARPVSSPLHSRFTWDNTEAAQQWRLHEARNLINIVVEFLPGDKSETPVRVFVSMKSDRKPDGGYRMLVDVMSDAALYRKLLQEALEDVEALRAKYHRLKEMAPVFALVERIRKKTNKRSA